MQAKMKYYLLCLALLACRVFDITTTAWYTPDLRKESNIVVSQMGGGWAAVMVVQAAVLVLICFLLHYYFFAFRPVRPMEKDLSIKEYVSFFHFYNPSHFAAIFFRLPKNWNGFLSMSGYVGTATLLVASILAGCSTSLLLVSSG